MAKGMVEAKDVSVINWEKFGLRLRRLSSVLLISFVYICIYAY